MIAHPNAQAAASVRATQDRMASNAKTVVCSWCEHVTDQGPKSAPLSHMVCDHKDCQMLALHTIHRGTIEHLHLVSSIAWGRYVSPYGEHKEDPTDTLRAAFDRAEARFRNALRKFTEDKERGR